MASLELVPRLNARQLGEGKFKLTAYCVNRCKPRSGRSAKWTALVAGYPTATLCDDCATEWEKSWEKAGGRVQRHTMSERFTRDTAKK